jgi:hypothetical protein
MVLAAALGSVEIEFIDGVLGNIVGEKAIPVGPESHERLLDALVGYWQAHMNAIQGFVATLLRKRERR